MSNIGTEPINGVNFKRIAEAIKILRSNFPHQPSLNELAKQINVSAAHFQKIFTEWAGVSPKKFTQFITISHAKQILRNSSEQNTASTIKNATLFDTAAQTGLSGSGRLHDLFINIEGMTPGEYKNGGAGLIINYGIASTYFGNIIVASTEKGICHISFFEDETTALQNLINSFLSAVYLKSTEKIHQKVFNIFNADNLPTERINLHIKGTPFQIKVWEALLKIPQGKLNTYGNIANKIERPKASRAVGTAIGQNPIAYLIPCHRVIQSTGLFGGYMWGMERKTAMIGWEAARIVIDDEC